MKDFGFIFVFFAILLALALMPKSENGGIFSGLKNATSTRTTHTTSTTSSQRNLTYSSPDTQSPRTSTERPARPQKELTNDEKERKIASAYRTLDGLKEDLRKAKLEEPASPYAGLITLSGGSTQSTDPDREYLTIKMKSGTHDPIQITGWYLKSYVTDEVSSIPRGDRIITRWRSPASEPIQLFPGDTAQVMTGESPIDTSFHENKCTGYLTEQATFPIGLSRQCPRPLDEMKQYGKIKLDNDSCYAFVGRIQSCTVPNDDAIDDADLTGTCTYFIKNYLNYNSCVEKHATDPYFDNVGIWHIYLDERTELWRSKREIIRLFDENDRIVDVLEY